MPTPNPAYDILLDGKGYMLARNDSLGRGGRRWRVENVGASIASQTAMEARYGNQPPIVEAPMVWKTCHLGYGEAETRGEGYYHYAINVDARFPEQVIPGPEVNTVTVDGTANVNRIFEQRGRLYLLAGQYCKRIGRDGAVHTEQDFGEGKRATDAAVYNGVLYVAMGYEEPFWTLPVGEEYGVWGATLWGGSQVWVGDEGWWTQADGLYMGHLAAFKDRLWASTSAYQVQCVAADPTVSANWGAVYPVGDPGQQVNALAELGELLYIGKEDGMYCLGSDGRAQHITPELKGFVSASNCRNMRVWHGRLIVPHMRGLLGYQGMGESGFMITPLTPGADATDECPVRGQITALAGDNRWLYVALYTGADTYLLAGREEPQSGVLLWHPLAKLAGTKCEAMHLSGIWANPRLWFGMGKNAGYIVLPRYGDNPLMDSNCRYSTTGSLYYSRHDWGTPTTRKIFKSIEVLGERLTSTRYVNVYYRVDKQGWKLAGKANLPPRHVLALPDGGVAGNRIEIRLDFVTPNTTPPIIRGVVVRAVERPQTVSVITAMVRCADHLPLRLARQDSRQAREMLSDLKALSTSDRAVRLVDTTGYKRWVVVLPGIEEAETEQEASRERELVLTVRMAEFSVDTDSEQATPYGIWGTSGWGSDAWQ
jgi:hypothetical protein